MRVEDDFSSEMTTQALMGMPVKVLQHRNWYRIQTPDNYIAWVHRVGIHPVTKAGLDAWNKADKIVVTSHYGFTYQQPDEKSQSVSDVVAGNRLKYEGTQGGFYKVSYPDGRQAYISQSISMPEKEWRASLKQDASKHHPHRLYNDGDSLSMGGHFFEGESIAAALYVPPYLCTISSFPVMPLNRLMWASISTLLLTSVMFSREI